ncbi:hypothetical protein NC653_037910 [Populus alba x Populus x berolinensis]|uniref:Uncharacterized protein n=1 Tax=Populus alba x Populus x berolinensis TaxID=444605 RepID=A0AAD6PTF8_9ROSI|nr:hypothetical protein NC653_037910 [Populus alba x Populus x berolinensis]
MFAVSADQTQILLASDLAEFLVYHGGAEISQLLWNLIKIQLIVAYVKMHLGRDFPSWIETFFGIECCSVTVAKIGHLRMDYLIHRSLVLS